MLLWFFLGQFIRVGVSYVILCLLYFVFIILWFSVPVQSIVWHISSLKWSIMCGVGR